MSFSRTVGLSSALSMREPSADFPVCLKSRRGPREYVPDREGTGQAAGQ